MQKILIKSVIVLTFLVGASLTVSAQKTKRIQFAKGMTSTIVNGVGKQIYLFNIGKNQNLKLKLSSKGNKATLSVWDEESDMSEGSDGRNFEGHFENGGEYKIEIKAPKGISFSLKVEIK